MLKKNLLEDGTFGNNKSNMVLKMEQDKYD